MASNASGIFSYDVFLSFRGEDTRFGFTGNLWKALRDRGIRTFMDDEELRKGEEITPSLVKAIEGSRMAIVVLSQDYASSSFCLQELSNILDCVKGKGRSVWPVFYDVDPSHVRKLKRTYGEAMDIHEKRSNDNMDMLQKWKKALHQVANLSGFHYKIGDGYEHEFIWQIVEQVSREIKPFVLPVADYLVGLESQKQNVVSLLNVGSDHEVHMVGIHGIGGIGKTTLALAVYNLIAHAFEGSCFLEKVRENSEKHGLSYLQKILLSETVGEKNIELTSVKQGIAIIQQRLRQKKVLLILDDVDKLEQLQAIVGEPRWFGRGSRVIITTRDKGLLRCHGVGSTYEVEELNENDAFELLGWKAFRADKVSPNYTYVLNRAVTFASGLPLALEVIGSHFFGKSIEKWKSTLDRYERIPNKEIQKILKVSFDALEEEERSVFLDIACCFKGYKLATVKKILHAHHGDDKKDDICVLVEKSLIKISDSGDVILHDLIEDMGKEIVRRESPEDPGKRSRLWCPNDIVQVLEENTGTSKIEIICFNSRIKVLWRGEAFKKMKNLRTLIVSGGHFFRSPKHLPNSLRVLEWHGNDSKGLLPYLHLKKLAICRLGSSDFIANTWGDLFEKKFENMKVLYLDGCEFLTRIPNVSNLPNLEELSLQFCNNISTIDDSVGLLRKLKTLSIEYCKKLRSFPPLKLPSLERLDLSSCGTLESIPPMDGSLGKLKILSFKNCRKLRSIPPLKLPLLEQLDLSYCDSLESIPPMDEPLGKLKILSVEGCRKLRGIPPLSLPSLEQLDLSYCDSLKSIPPMDESLAKLKILSFKNCRKLRSIPPLNLPLLEKLILSSCSILESIPPIYGLLGKLKILSVEDCWKLKSIPPFKLPSLEQLNLSYCHSLESFPEILGVMENITQLCLVDTPIKELPFSFQNFSRLQSLYLSRCGNVQLPRSIVMMSELAKLTIDDGGWLFPKQDEGEEKVSPVYSSQVEFIRLSNFDLPRESLGISLKWFANVKELDLSWSKLTILPGCIEKCHFLQKLDLDYCKDLQEIEGIPPSLKTLYALDCKSLTSSSKSKLLNQELHEAGNTWFCLPRAKIPEWCDHQSMEGLSVSFWFRNKFPAIVLFVVSPLTWGTFKPLVRVMINGNTFFYTDGENKHQSSLATEWYHLHLFHMQMENFNDNLDEALLENQWNHAEVNFGFPFQNSGIHVLKEKSSMEDILFTNPKND